MTNYKNYKKYIYEFHIIVIIFVVFNSLVLTASSKKDELSTMDRKKMLLLQQQKGAAVTADKEKQSKDIAHQFNKIWNEVVEKTKSEFLTPIGAMYIFEKVAGLIDALHSLLQLKWVANKLNDTANLVEGAPDLLRTMLDPIKTAPDKLRSAVIKLDMTDIKKIDEALVTIQTQKKDIENMNLKAKAPIAELAELEELLLKSLKESEKFLGLLKDSLTKTKIEISQIIDPVTKGVQKIEDDKRALLDIISRGMFGYPGLAARLRAVAKIIYP